jgi:hypothetical protein
MVLLLALALILLGWALEILGIAIGGEGTQENPFADIGTEEENPDGQYPPCRTACEAWRAARRDVSHWLVYVRWMQP